MKALKAITPEWYDSKVADGARFRLRGLTGLELIEAADQTALGPDGQPLITAKTRRVALEYGLLDWQNFTDDNGEVPFTANRAANLARLPAQLVKELFDEIFERTEIGEAAQKK